MPRNNKRKSSDPEEPQKRVVEHKTCHLCGKQDEVRVLIPCGCGYVHCCYCIIRNIDTRYSTACELKLADVFETAVSQFEPALLVDDLPLRGRFDQSARDDSWQRHSHISEDLIPE